MGTKYRNYRLLCLLVQGIPCLIPRHLSLIQKIGVQRKVERRKQARGHFSFLICPSHGILHFIISQVHFVLALIQNTKRLRRRQGCPLYMRST